VRLLCATGAEDPAEAAALTPAVAAIARDFALEATVLPIRSVGVKADLRSYEHPVLLHGAADHERRLQAAGEILKRAPGINRCVWNLGPALPREVRPLRAPVTRERLDLLSEADHLVMEGLQRHGLYDEIWQCPTVLAPLSFDGRGGELVIVRPVLSERAMTARPAPLPEALTGELRAAILALPGVTGLALDITSKPPGTIEWE